VHVLYHDHQSVLLFGLFGLYASDIYDCKIKLILGLLWSLMLRYQIQNRKEILEWVQELLNNKNDLVHIENLDSSWSNGVAFCLLVNRFVPNAIATADIKPDTPLQNMQAAFSCSEKLLDIPPLLEADDHMLMGEREVLTYLSFFYHIRNRLEPELPPEPVYDEVAELKQLLAQKERVIQQLHVQIQDQSTEIQSLKQQLQDASARTQAAEAEAAVANERIAATEVASQELIREVRIMFCHTTITATLNSTQLNSTQLNST
jgi:outer membrane murein-binding lipoprotein Lpp